MEDTIPFLRAFRAWRSSACSLTCCFRVMFPLRAISGARVIRCIKRFVGDRRSRQACLSSVPSDGELSSRDRSRSICWAGVCGGEAAGVELSRSFASTVTGRNGINPAIRQPLRMLCLLRALSLARIYVPTHCAVAQHRCLVNERGPCIAFVRTTRNQTSAVLTEID